MIRKGDFCPEIDLFSSSIRGICNRFKYLYGDELPISESRAFFRNVYRVLEIEDRKSFGYEVTNGWKVTFSRSGRWYIAKYELVMGFHRFYDAEKGVRRVEFKFSFFKKVRSESLQEISDVFSAKAFCNSWLVDVARVVFSDGTKTIMKGPGGKK